MFSRLPALLKDVIFLKPASESPASSTIMIDPSSASLAIVTLNGRPLSGQPIKADYAYARNLPLGFDSATHCRSVHLRNIHPKVTEPHLHEVFSRAGAIEGCQLLKTNNSLSYGFVDYYDPRSASLAIVTLNGLPLLGQPIKVEWAYKCSQLGVDTSDDHRIIVCDLDPNVSNDTLFACFSVYSSCSNAQVMSDEAGSSKGIGFVYFKNREEAERAIDDLNGKWLGNRQLQCIWVR